MPLAAHRAVWVRVWLLDFLSRLPITFGSAAEVASNSRPALTVAFFWYVVAKPAKLLLGAAPPEPGETKDTARGDDGAAAFVKTLSASAIHPKVNSYPAASENTRTASPRNPAADSTIAPDKATITATKPSAFRSLASTIRLIVAIPLVKVYNSSALSPTSSQNLCPIHADLPAGFLA